VAVTLSSFLANNNNSISALITGTPPGAQTFVSGQLEYGYTSGGPYPFVIPATGSDPHVGLNAVVPPQAPNTTVYAKAQIQWSLTLETSTEKSAAIGAAVPANYTNPTGKQNVMNSFKQWLKDNVASGGAPNDFTFYLAAGQVPAQYPAVTVEEFQFFEPEADAMGMQVFPASSYPIGSPSTQGSKNELQMMIEIMTAQGNTDGLGTQQGALKQLYQLRDRFRRALVLAGVCDDVTGNQIVPPIYLLDYDNGAAPTGIICELLPTSGTGLQERYIKPDNAQQQIHRYQLLVKLRWYEMN
jgi:hypothetical protein